MMMAVVVVMMMEPWPHTGENQTLLTWSLTKTREDGALVIASDVTVKKQCSGGHLILGTGTRTRKVGAAHVDGVAC